MQHHLLFHCCLAVETSRRRRRFEFFVKRTRNSNAGNSNVIGKSVSLVGIAESDQINKDAKFLDEIKKLFDEYETSVQFTIARNQLENAYKAARSSLKKRIRNEKDANTDA